MSPTMQMAAPPPVTTAYTPTSDVMDRHEYGVSKNRKAASTGGGRAWSEDEEVYLLQTRLQKMPYKHIAAHLKKTELACRLHYHQLSHGSNRRKRTTSVSSGSSTGGHSPILPASIPSPIRESSSRSASPPGSAGSYGPGSPAGGVQLPSIMTAGGGNSNSPRLPAILPKPASMTPAITSTATAAGGRATSASNNGYPTPIADVATPHSAPLMPAVNFVRTPTSANPHSNSHSHPHHHPSLRLDCASATALPPLHHHTQTHPSSAPLAHLPVDLTRLGAIYAAHRGSFWAAVAAEYGAGASPAVLEQAWKSGACCGSHAGGGSISPAATSAPYHAQHHPHQAHQHQTPQYHNTGGQTATPITPVHSPEDRDAYPVASSAAAHGTTAKPSDKTRISAILGIDADPRSPKEREMVRRLEERVGA